MSNKKHEHIASKEQKNRTLSEEVLEEENLGQENPLEVEELEEAEEEKEEKNQAEPAAEEEEDLKTRYLRLAADFQNYRRRTEKEKNDIYAYANEKLIIELLGVIDNFERALSVENTETGIIEGMGMVLRQMKGALEKSGLEEIRAVNEEFDPNFHHAVIMATGDPADSGKVLEVMQKGYLLNKKVIRAAMVKVAE